MTPLRLLGCPLHCRDDELMALFRKSGPGANGTWAHYADGESKTPINESKMAALGEIGSSFWAAREWHLMHCLFSWGKYMHMRLRVSCWRPDSIISRTCGTAVIY